ncbi:MULTISPECIES: nucleotidyltransferase domain-containing protein [Pseudoalteromonas]|uniref:Putative nucleotidyltransferase n=1 Tax=Pseudoalteromonas luteoviolacea (strain 2ta16) TaxID=1353533 RepID=V4H4S3_PSEL2|nr:MULTISPECIES: nucleotidyltransferase domain-containing protein [Pseudoalteromonas]ESP92476.1 putative nucleotidyltransferase [Pseudoalteromonas luteoviolacea 2ta16]KZN35035.1 hypothetical protein N483_24140 [Pseudoalteromonas luteoviolacea NCIMB 1944]MCG7550672.1 nucleotidyltransferase domain-containing protein [Pseudoalteromonas sp. Of7M-16]
MNVPVNSIAPEIRHDIMTRIKNTEQEHNVKVLYAIESGSRAWGFASSNSDYDVRFIYAHPKDWYLSVMLEDQRDVIEYPIVDDIDINGWDLRKALKLLRVSNPAIGEWLQSPIVYINHNHFQTQVMALFKQYYKAERGLYHYFNMAKNNYRGYLKNEYVPRKKYLYVMRALCAARWIERFKSPPPIEFEALVAAVIDDSVLFDEIQKLVVEKLHATEKALGPQIPTLNRFIEAELNHFNYQFNKSDVDQNTAALDKAFLQMLDSI